MVKRCLDVFLILLSAPLMLLTLGAVAVVVMLSSPGPVFYSHRRIRKERCVFFHVEVPDDVRELGRGTGGVSFARIRRRGRSGTRPINCVTIPGLLRSDLFCGDTAWTNCRSFGMCWQAK